MLYSKLQGDVPKAELYLKRALEEAKAGFGEDDGHVAAALNNLAELYRNKQQFDLAKSYYMEVQLMHANSPSSTFPIFSAHVQ